MQYVRQETTEGQYFFAAAFLLKHCFAVTSSLQQSCKNMSASRLAYKWAQQNGRNYSLLMIHIHVYLAITTHYSCIFVSTKSIYSQLYRTNCSLIEFLVFCETIELWNAIAQIGKLPKLYYYVTCTTRVSLNIVQIIDYCDSILSADNNIFDVQWSTQLDIMNQKLQLCSGLHLKKDTAN